MVESFQLSSYNHTASFHRKINHIILDQIGSIDENYCITKNIGGNGRTTDLIGGE